MISELSEIHLQLNPEINEAIEKLYLNININSKEQREKGKLELQKTFLERLSKQLEKSNKREISDLILDKSIVISEITQDYDWPLAESLKVPNLHRSSNQLYIYVRTRLNFLSGKGKKHIKDGAIKGIENIITILNSIIDSGVKYENLLVYLFFEDLFSFYCLSDFNEKSKESIDELISLIKEECNISSLVKMDNIDNTAEDNFFLGTLATLLQFKMELATSNKEINLSDLENIFKHEKVLRKVCFLCDVNFVWIYLSYNFINNEKNENVLKYCNICCELLKTLKIYKQFLLPNHSKLIEIVFNHIHKIRSLIVIYFIHNQVHLTESFFMKLDFSQIEIDELKGISIYNISPVSKLFKNNIIGDNLLVQFENLIIKKLENNITKKDNNEIKKVNEQFNELIIPKASQIDERDIKNNENYLMQRLTERNKRYNELLNF